LRQFERVTHRASYIGNQERIMAAKSGAQRHTHKYRKLPNSDIWGCGFGNCTHLLPRNMTAMIEERQSICWTCGDTMLMRDKQMKMDKPICDNCILKAAGINEDKTEAILAFINKAEVKAPAIEEVVNMDEDDDGRLY
jgi:formylmethanofuran dehydrogenase subunit E